MWNSKALLAACLLSVLPAAAQAVDAPTPSLSLESTILFSLNQNPSIKAEMEKISQAQDAIREAQSAYYPQASVNIKGGHEFDDPAGLEAGVYIPGKAKATVNSYDTSFVISQVLFNGFATDENVDRRRDLKNSATYASIVTIEGILQNAIQYYLDVWRYQRAVAESQSFVDQLDRIGKKVSLMSEAGAESKAKQEYVQSRVASAQSELNKAKASLADALSNLESLTGNLPPFVAERPLQLDPTLRSLDSYFELARKHNTRLLLNDSDDSAVKHQIEEAKASYLPTVNLEVDGNHGYDLGGHVGNIWNASAMVVLNYKLFDGFARSATEDRLKSEEAENRFQQIQLERDLDKDIRKAYNQLLAVKQDLTSNTKEVLSSENLQGMYQKQFELGEGDVITMIEGYERLHSARLGSFRLESEMVLDSYTLLQKVGALSKERFCSSC